MRILYLLGQLLFIPHILLFLMSPNKRLIVEDLNAVRSKRKGKSVYNELSFTLLRNKYFRTLFYFRTRSVFSKILRIFFKQHSSFILDVNTEIGGGVQLAHPYATIINAKSIGENLYINHLVTVGEKNGQKPIIGNNVQLHAACIVIGEITIGDNAIIGAGAVVVKDVPPSAVVVGNPARQIN